MLESDLGIWSRRGPGAWSLDAFPVVLAAFGRFVSSNLHRMSAVNSADCELFSNGSDAMNLELTSRVAWQSSLIPAARLTER